MLISGEKTLLIDNLSHALRRLSQKRTHFVCACHPDGGASVACASAYFSLIYVMLYRGSAKVCGVCVRYIKLFSIQQKHHPAVISHFVCLRQWELSSEI